jgi:cytochrome c-type biogenesis protein CcmH
MSRLALALLLCGAVSPALALDAREVLPDPALEQRARALSAELRCLVCQNQSIDDSDAQLARDLRRVVRERLVAGDDDAAVKRFLVERYGEFVLLRPAFSLANAALWLSPFLLLAAAGGYLLLRARPRPAFAAPLTEDEERRILALLDGADARPGAPAAPREPPG